jgi:primosomal protein N'
VTEEGLLNLRKGIAYQFDSIFTSASNNKEIFEMTLKNLIDSGMKGYDGSVFCYGQTGSGKTYTMYGSKDDPGIAPRAIKYLFEQINGNSELSFKITIGFLEIYNEVVNDLLDASKKNLTLVEIAKGTVIIKDLTEVLCETQESAEEVLKLGETNKHIGSTQANDKSSRSHTMYYKN